MWINVFLRRRVLSFAWEKNMQIHGRFSSQISMVFRNENILRLAATCAEPTSKADAISVAVQTMAHVDLLNAIFNRKPAST